MRREDMTRKKIIIITILLVLGIAVYKSNIVDLIRLYYALSNWTYVEDFDKYQEDYQNIADFVIDYRDELLKTSKDNMIVVYKEKEVKMYNIDTRKEIILTKENKKSLENIYNTFYDTDYHEFSEIRITDDFVKFGTDRMFEVVYSRNGTKPKGLGLPEDSYYNFKIKKLAKDWYSVNAD